MINVTMLLENAHLVLLDTVDGLSVTEWSHPPVDDTCTCRDILAYLTAIEMVLIALIQPTSATTLLEMFCGNRPKFDQWAVENSADWSLATLFNQYEAAHATLISGTTAGELSATVPQRGLHRYGRTVGDCLLALGYGHKLIQATRIGAFRQQQFNRLHKELFHVS